jgi:hypothetical protein
VRKKGCSLINWGNAALPNVGTSSATRVHKYRLKKKQRNFAIAWLIEFLLSIIDVIFFKMVFIALNTSDARFDFIYSLKFYIGKGDLSAVIVVSLIVLLILKRTNHPIRMIYSVPCVILVFFSSVVLGFSALPKHNDALVFYCSIVLSVISVFFGYMLLYKEEDDHSFHLKGFSSDYIKEVDV